jgi:hypothetical protein
MTITDPIKTKSTPIINGIDPLTPCLIPDMANTILAGPGLMFSTLLDGSFNYNAQIVALVIMLAILNKKLTLHSLLVLEFASDKHLVAYLAVMLMCINALMRHQVMNMQLNFKEM